jgi:hypothetical protein
MVSGTEPFKRTSPHAKVPIALSVKAGRLVKVDAPVTLFEILPMATSNVPTATVARLRAIRDRLQAASVPSSTGDQSAHSESIVDADALDAAIFELTQSPMDRIKATALVVRVEIARLNALQEELRPALHALQDKVIAFGYKARDYDERRILSVRESFSDASAAIWEATGDPYALAGTLAGFAQALSDIERLVARARSSHAALG